VITETIASVYASPLKWVGYFLDLTAAS